MSLLRRGGVALGVLACALALCLGLTPSTARADEPAWTYDADAETLTSDDGEGGQVTLINVTADDEGKLTIGDGFSAQAYEYDSFGSGFSGKLDLTGTVTGGGDSAYTIAAIKQYAFIDCDAFSSVVIPGSVGSIGDYAFKGCTRLASVNIGDGVTSIGYSAFYGCSSLSSVVIPNSVTSIGAYAFTSCKALSSVDIPDSVGSISSNTFGGCSSLESVVIPNSVTSIGTSAFQSCTSLESVDIGSGVTSIGASAFAYCSSLESVTIPDSVTSIGASAFKSCTSLTSVVIPNSVTSIGGYAFQSCTSLTSVVIPNSVTSIGASAFTNCTSLTSVVIPNSVTSIGASAFQSCTSLESVDIGRGVTSIGASAFTNCTSLEKIEVDGDNTAYASEDGVLYAKDKTKLLVFPGGRGGDFTVPETVTSIGASAFTNCTSLESVTILGSVGSIGNYAFDGCTLLASVGIGSGVTSIGYSAFYGCTSLESVDIPGSVTSIGDYAFGGCTRLESVDIGSGVTSIGEYAFYGCSALETVALTAETPPGLEKYVFASCNSLNKIVVPVESVSYYQEASGWSSYKDKLTPGYYLDVNDGSGSGLYAEGATVTVEAGEEPDEGRHVKWTLEDAGGGQTATAYGKGAELEFEMPAWNAKATYELEAHSFGGWTDDGDGTHSRTCACGEAEVLAHTFSGGYCTVCGAEDPDYVPPVPAPTYAAEVAEAEHGTASASPSRARAGQRVTVTATPDEGFEVRSVVVTDASGEAVEVAEGADGTWSFSMPAGGATVSVEFGCDGGALCPSAGLADVDSSQWYHDAVDLAVSSGLMTGYDDGSGLFGVGDGLTREQAATVLWRALGGAADAPSCGMADVDQAAWYAPAVGWAVSSGLMTGYADGSGLFGVGDALTREQLATVLWRAAGSPDAGAYDPSAFSDGGEASAWAEPALAWATSTGVLSGSDDGAGGTELRPTAAVTRAEMAAMVTRWLAAE